MTFDELFDQVRDQGMDQDPESSMGWLHLWDCRYSVTTEAPLDPEELVEPIYQVTALAMDSSQAVHAAVHYYITAQDPAYAVALLPTWTAVPQPGEKPPSDLSTLPPDRRGDGLLILGETRQGLRRAEAHAWQQGWQRREDLDPRGLEGTIYPMYPPLEQLVRQISLRHPDAVPPGASHQELLQHARRGCLMNFRIAMAPRS